MRDVPKNVSTDDAHVVHGRTHTQEELQESRPLTLGGLRVLIALVVPVLFGIFVTAVVLQQPDAHTIRAGITGVAASAVALFVLAAVFTGFGNPADWLREYWQRNVRGYAVAYWLDDQGKLVGRISTRLLPNWRFMSDRSPTIYLPLGGWLHRSRFAYSLDYLHDLQGVRVRWPWFEPTPDKVWVTDRIGARAKLWIHDALTLWGVHGRCGGFELDGLCRKLLRDLEYRERDLQTAYTRLLEVYDRIVATKRFIRSTQAQAIADDLRWRLHELLPPDHPRCAEFARARLAKAAPATAKI